MRAFRQLAACAAASLLTVTLSAALPASADTDGRTFSDDALTYEITDGSARITKAQEGLVTIEIPEKIGEYPILSIGEYAFADCVGLRKVHIKGGLKTIETGAFSGCTSLSDITFGDALETVGDGAFYYCGSLEELHLPETVTAIGVHAFAGCFSLKSLTLPAGVTEIPDYAFYYDDALESVDMPDGLTRIGDMAFVRCDKLRALNIPASVTEISDYAFISCSGIESVTITGTASAPAYKTGERGVLFDSAGSTLLLYPAACEETSYTVPDGVSAITAYAFSGAAALKEIQLPDSVQSLGEGAFSGCKSLSQFTLPKNVTSIAGTLFAETGLTAFIVPEGVTEIGDYAFYRCTALGSVRIPDSVTKIGTAAFFNCTSLKELTLPDSVTEIGENALGFRLDPNAANDQSIVVQEDFLLRGTAKSGAKTYADSAGVKFKATDFSLTLIICIAAAVLLIAAVIAAVLVRRRKAANTADGADVPAPEDEFDTNYTSILDGDGDPFERSDNSAALTGEQRAQLEDEEFPND